MVIDAHDAEIPAFALASLRGRFGVADLADLIDEFAHGLGEELQLLGLLDHLLECVDRLPFEGVFERDDVHARAPC